MTNDKRLKWMKTVVRCLLSVVCRLLKGLKRTFENLVVFVIFAIIIQL